MSKIAETRGDLFTKFEECRNKRISVSLMHCVSKDLKMGKGIAVTFKKKFGRVDELIGQSKNVGEVAVLDLSKEGGVGGEEEEEGSFAYYLVTKPNYYDKPTYKTLRDSLEAAKNHAVANKVGAILMPKIGCGLDRLELSRAKQILSEVFAETSVTINVFCL